MPANAHNDNIEGLPKFPLTCLQTADFVDTEKIIKGKNTVIGTFLSKQSKDVVASMHRHHDAASSSIPRSLCYH
jgi:hypothetical protein